MLIRASEARHRASYLYIFLLTSFSQPDGFASRRGQGVRALANEQVLNFARHKCFGRTCMRCATCYALLPSLPWPMEKVRDSAFMQNLHKTALTNSIAPGLPTHGNR